MSGLLLVLRNEGERARDPEESPRFASEDDQPDGHAHSMMLHSPN